MAPISTIAAATLVIFRQNHHGSASDACASYLAPEFLFVERDHAMRFAGGATVFPGGRIDEADYALAHELAGKPPQAQAYADAVDTNDLAARLAAIRETLEETGLAVAFDRPIGATEAANARRMLQNEGALAPVLVSFGWRVRPESLIAFARWCPMWEGSFDTRFFLADIGHSPAEVQADFTENRRAFWMSAAAALAAAERGDIHLIYPTRRNLERLALFANFEEARKQALRTPICMITPRRVIRNGRVWLTIPDGLGYPILEEVLDEEIPGGGQA